MGNDKMSNTILEIRNLQKAYSDNQENQEILSNVNLQVNRDEFLCILGPSGCGKTTLLRCIAGFEDFNGEIIVNGDPKKQPGPDRLMVFQTFDQLFPWKTVEGNITWPLKKRGITNKSQRKEAALEALRKVKLADYRHYYPHQLSGGMKQRVAIAKALALKSEIILMDEPFAALDALTRRELQNELLSISATEHRTILFVTHNIQEAVILGTRSIVMQKGGRIVYDKKNTLSKPVTPSSPGYGEIWQQMRDAIYEV